MHLEVSIWFVRTRFRVRQGLGDAISKGTLIKVPGLGALIKVPLEVSIRPIEARFGYVKVNHPLTVRQVLQRMRYSNNYLLTTSKLQMPHTT